MSAPEGRTLGSYRLLERIGKGGMGEVYRARHVKLGREAAVKILPPALAAEPDFLKRFEREAASAAALNHPNILQVYDYGEQDGTPYLVMPYIGGGTLKDRLVGGTITPGGFARALTEVAGALDYAHRQGIVHRDVKPANILIDDDERAYLADFGIAKAIEGGEALTQTGLGVGTPEYMAPEQSQGRAEPRSDLYALGVMLFQLLTGRVPYSGASTVEVLLKHLQEPVPLGALRGPAAREFGPILSRALAKDPAGRYPTGRELMAVANAALARIGVADAGAQAAYHSGAAQGPQRGTPAPSGTPSPQPRGTPPPATGTAPDDLTMHRPQGTPPPSPTQPGHRPTEARPQEPPRATNTPAPDAGTGAGADADGHRTNPAEWSGPESDPTRFGPDNATRLDPSGAAGSPAPPPARFDAGSPPTQFGTAPPRAQDGYPSSPNGESVPSGYRPPTFVGAAEVQMRRAGGGPLANMDTNTRRLVIIIASVVAVVFLLCCCLFGLSLLGSGR